jgi:hypothetical protein
LAVAVEVVHNSHDQGQGKDAVQGDGKKVVQFRPLQFGLIESLEVKNRQMSQQEERENGNIIYKRRNPPFGVNIDEGIETKKIGIKEGKRNGDNITEKK